ncbi:UNVERIFIED_CONTAM: hypothetical protein GTU68_001328 [Idotea baltica]|nr:hypothetical protein [Idotea baltica]
MAIVGFKMKLKTGFKEVYKKRHDEIWPELKRTLKNAGVIDYAIFFDEETETLFGYQKVDKNYSKNNLKESYIVKKWWEFMADIMQVNPDNSPVVFSLDEVFWLSS